MSRTNLHKRRESQQWKRTDSLRKTCTNFLLIEIFQPAMYSLINSLMKNEIPFLKSKVLLEVGRDRAGDDISSRGDFERMGHSDADEVKNARARKKLLGNVAYELWCETRNELESAKACFRQKRDIPISIFLRDGPRPRNCWRSSQQRQSTVHTPTDCHAQVEEQDNTSRGAAKSQTTGRRRPTRGSLWADV